MLAARDAKHAHAYEEAAEHCRRVLEDLGDDAGTARCEARLELAAALEQAGEVEDSRAAFAEAARDARALQRRRAALDRGARLRQVAALRRRRPRGGGAARGRPRRAAD